jgi:aryl-alcohol dehydrogenase-like predicted oxidoreductase
MMQNKQGIVPLVTGSSVAQLEENLQALSVNLSESNQHRLDWDTNQHEKY